MSHSVGREKFKTFLTRKVSPGNLKLIMRAYKQAKYGHRNQRRDNDERYFEHPKRVALILIRELGIYDHEMIIAALLHDIAEDSYILGFEDIEAMFGERVTSFVRILTKDQCEPEEKPKRDLLYHQRLLDEGDEDVRIIKCADRLDNLRDLMCCTIEKKQHYLEETESHYISMARQVAPDLYEEMILICEETKQFLSRQKEDTNEY